MSAYTDEDVRLVARTLYAEQGGPEEFSTLAPSFRARWLTDAERVLHAIAPAIAARALREVAAAHRASRTSHQEPIWPSQLDIRADAIEAAQ